HPPLANFAHDPVRSNPLEIHPMLQKKLVQGYRLFTRRITPNGEQHLRHHETRCTVAEETERSRLKTGKWLISGACSGNEPRQPCCPSRRQFSSSTSARSSHTLPASIRRPLAFPLRGS